MTAASAPGGGRTAWARNLAAPVRDYLSTETVGALALLGAVVAALIWANVAPHSYTSVWGTEFSLHLGSWSLHATLREWVNQGLMTFFFLVVGLEAKRELDLGELRERRRLALPVVAAIGGAAGAIIVYLVINAGGPGAHGWGTAMSTDTAFALGILALIARRGERLRVFLLSLAVVDDLIALVVLAVGYTTGISVTALVVAVVLYAAIVLLRFAPFPARQPVAVVLAVGMWIAMFKSGIDPVVAGLAVGLALSAYEPGREDLERVTELSRSFREQPTPELARRAQQSVASAISPERAPAVRPAPVDELRDRAGVRAGQRRDRVQLEPALRRRHLADHHRHRRRLRCRQAARHPHLVLAGHPPAHAQPAPAHQLADPLRRRRRRPASGSRSRC